jgi:PIN domain nuclease of toxin-antitoxin system
MAAMIYLDTHVVFWLYAEGPDAPLSATARTAIKESSDLRISPMVRLELQYLYEIERTGTPAGPILDELSPILGLRICEVPFAAVVQAAVTEGWTRDPFDRLIVSQAATNNAGLVTKDHIIRTHYPNAIW